MTEPGLIQTFLGPSSSHHLYSADSRTYVRGPRVQTSQPWFKGMPSCGAHQTFRGFHHKKLGNKPLFMNGCVSAFSWYSLKPRCATSVLWLKTYQPASSFLRKSVLSKPEILPLSAKLVDTRTILTWGEHWLRRAFAIVDCSTCNSLDQVICW